MFSLELSIVKTFHSLFMIYSISLNLIVIKMISDKHTFHFIVGSRKVRSIYLLCFLLCEI